MFPTASFAQTLAAAATISSRSAARRGNGIELRTQCPQADGDCQIRIQLVHNGHAVATAGYQQPPGTLHSVRVVPLRASDRRALQRGAKTFRLVVHMEHAGEPPTATAAVRI